MANMLNLKKWWVSSMSGWILELLMELIMIMVINDIVDLDPRPCCPWCWSRSPKR